MGAGWGESARGRGVRSGHRWLGTHGGREEKIDLRGWVAPIPLVAAERSAMASLIAAWIGGPPGYRCDAVLQRGLQSPFAARPTLRPFAALPGACTPAARRGSTARPARSSAPSLPRRGAGRSCRRSPGGSRPRRKPQRVPWPRPVGRIGGRKDGHARRSAGPNAAARWVPARSRKRRRAATFGGAAPPSAVGVAPACNSTSLHTTGVAPRLSPGVTSTPRAACPLARVLAQ